MTHQSQISKVNPLSIFILFYFFVGSPSLFLLLGKKMSSNRVVSPGRAVTGRGSKREESCLRPFTKPMFGSSTAIFRISFVLSAVPPQGWRMLGWRVGMSRRGDWREALSPHLCHSPSLDLSLQVRRAVMPQFAAPLIRLPPRYVTCHPPHKDPPHTHTHTQLGGWNEIWMLYCEWRRGAIEYVGEWGLLLW